MTKTMARCSHLFAVVALVVCAATARAEVVSLDGMWQAEVAQDAQGDAMPAAFTRTIPVPGHWPLMKPSAPYGGEARRRVTVRVPADAKGTIKVRSELPDGTCSKRRWESLLGDKKPWVEIDLGEEREVRECKIRWFRAWKKPPAKWRVSPALPARTRYVLIEIDDISPNKLASIEEVEIQSAARGD